MKHTHIIAATITLVAGTLLGTGCKKHDPIVKPAFIEQNYQVQYYTDKNTTRADAYFNYAGFSGGMSVQFVDPQVVRLNGQSSQIVASPNGSQMFLWDVAGTPDAVFTVTLRDGTTLTNKVDRAMMGELNLEIDSVLYVTDTMYARWTGTALQEGEFVGISMNRESDSTNLYSGATGNFYGPGRLDGHMATFDFAETSKFHPGIYTVGLAKTRNMPLQQPDGQAGGNISVTLSVTKRVVVK